MKPNRTMIALCLLAPLAPLVSGCEDAAPDSGTSEQPAGAMGESPRSRGKPRDAGTTSAEDAARGNPGADDASRPQPARPECEQAPIPTGELQNMAAGPSIFGRVFAGGLEPFDALGDSDCGAAEVRICLRDSDHCTDSDAAGQFVLAGLEAGADTLITFDKPGYRSALRLAQLGSVPIDTGKTRMIEDAASRSLVESVGLTRDADHGAIIVVALAPGEGIGGIILPEGVKVSLQPGDHTPFYSTGEVEPGGLSAMALDPELTATRGGGWAAFFEVPPGDFTVRFERDGAPCTQSIPGYGLGQDDAGDVKVKVVPGFSTSGIAALCL